ncbi:unnamed protein product [Pleuronectes platessa]|uniref:Uncharacterized protein n=1 Tax=Pleuronectes platessa TaxID=8262 RepID=A0A9N7ZEU4_PLEPL|nr:unnamed protein product [Pleuronectes platessa]
MPERSSTAERRGCSPSGRHIVPVGMSFGRGREEKRGTGEHEQAGSTGGAGPGPARNRRQGKAAGGGPIWLGRQGREPPPQKRSQVVRPAVLPPAVAGAQAGSFYCSWP